MFENQISLAPRKEPESSTNIHPVEGFILRNSKHAAAVQIRRDGFAFSKLEPHSNWDSFVSSAQEQWKVFAEWFEVDVPFNVFIRYIKRVLYPLDNFKLTNYFEHPPLPPSGTNWAFRFFRDATPFSPPPVFLTVFIPKANS